MTSKWAVLAVVGSGVFMATLDMGMVNVALPTITTHFSAPVVLSQWVVLGQLLSITGLLLPFGRLADMLGRKRIFLAGFVVYAISSTFSALAPSLELLIVSRVVQGVGSAMLQSNSPGLLTQAFPTSERGRALGFNMAIVSAGFLSGPVLGGILVDRLGWPWLFAVSVPICLLAVGLGIRLLPEMPNRPEQRFDLAGSSLFLLTVVGLLLTFNRGGVEGWTSPLVLGVATITVVALVLFILVERRALQPIIEVGLFRIAGFRAALISGFLLFVGISQLLLLMPFYLQLVLKLAPSQVGLVLAIQPAVLVPLAPFAGSLSDRFGSRLLASLGAALVALALAALAMLDVNSGIPDVAVRLVLLSLGMGLFGSPNNSALFGALGRERYGVAGAYQALMRNLGQSVGQTIAGLLLTLVVTITAGVAVTAAPPAALMTGFRVVWLVAAALVGLGAVVSLVGRPATRSVPPPALPSTDSLESESEPETRRTLGGPTRD